MRAEQKDLHLWKSQEVFLEEVALGNLYEGVLSEGVA